MLSYPCPLADPACGRTTSITRLECQSPRSANCKLRDAGSIANQLSRDCQADRFADQLEATPHKAQSQQRLASRCHRRGFLSSSWRALPSHIQEQGIFYRMSQNAFAYSAGMLVRRDLV